MKIKTLFFLRVLQRSKHAKMVAIALLMLCIPVQSVFAGAIISVKYGPDDRNWADIYYPSAFTSDVPAVVYFHGGGFTSGDKALDNLTTRMVGDLNWRGVAFVTAIYRYAGNGHTLKDSMEDGMRLVAFLKQNQWQYHINPSRIIVSGTSAGAGIAQYIALQPNTIDSSVPRVKGGILFNAQTSYNPDHWNYIKANLSTDPNFDAYTGTFGDMMNTVTNGLLYSNRAAAVSLLDSVSPVTLTSSDDPVVSYYNWDTSLRPYNPASSDYVYGVLHNPQFPVSYQQMGQSKGEWIEVHHINDYVGKPRSDPTPTDSASIDKIYWDMIGCIMWLI